MVRRYHLFFFLFFFDTVLSSFQRVVDVSPEVLPESPSTLFQIVGPAFRQNVQRPNFTDQEGGKLG